MSDYRQKAQELETFGWNTAMQASVAEAVHRVGNIGCGVERFAKDCLRLLSTNTTNKQEIEDNLHRIIASGERMAKICHKLSNSGKDVKSVESINVEAAIRTIATNIISDGIQFDVECPRDCLIETDAHKFREILECLFENAIRATQVANSKDPRHFPRVTVETHLNRVEIDVADTGPGVPPSIVKRLGRTLVSSTWKGGNGIGLFVASLDATALGGRLDLVKNDGAGATFRLTLPKAARASKGAIA
jgi:two-component system C4-dicarboxylate transport sensor histidine kinase DctB